MRRLSDATPPGSRWATAVGPVVALLALAAACAPGLPADDRVAGRAASRTVSEVVAARPAPRLSPACTSPDGGGVPERLVVDGRERTVLARVPGGGGVPRDLVIAFHGRTNDAARARRYFGLDRALPDAVVVYPQALLAGPGRYAWSDPGDPVDAQRDFALVRAIVDAVGRTSCVDLERVFVAGHSLGASFANDVACRLGDVVRAVASVAGGLQAAPCDGSVAALLLHHPDDALVAIAHGERARDAFLAANGHGGGVATPTVPASLATLRCVRYGAAEAVHPVVWCPHDAPTSPSGRYDPHTWPIGAAAAIASFFIALP